MRTVSDIASQAKHTSMALQGRPDPTRESMSERRDAFLAAALSQRQPLLDAAGHRTKQPSQICFLCAGPTARQHRGARTQRIGGRGIRSWSRGSEFVTWSSCVACWHVTGMLGQPDHRPISQAGGHCLRSVRSALYRRRAGRRAGDSAPVRGAARIAPLPVQAHSSGDARVGGSARGSGTGGGP